MEARGEERDALLTQVVAKARAAERKGAASHLADFVGQYYHLVATEDLLAHDAADLLGAARSHWELAQGRPLGTPAVQVFNPSQDRDEWESPHTVVQIVTDDMPFLVDSVSMELTRNGRGIHLVVHPTVAVQRSLDGRLEDLLSPTSEQADAVVEAFLHIEIDRERREEQLDPLRADLLRVLEDVRAAVEDWQRMRVRMHEAVDELCARRPPVEDDVDESVELLRWIADGHFTFLGYREYDLIEEAGEDVLRPVLGTGLGVLRDSGYQPQSISFAKLPAHVRRKARERTLLSLTKANSRSTVHRPAYLDYIGVKRFDDSGNPIGERRFLGLYTSQVYAASPRDVPLLRRKVQAVLDRARLDPTSHLGKALAEVMERYPRDELFQATVDQLYDTAMGVLHLQERQQVRLFVRPDAFGRFVSCQVYLPRDRYTTAVRERMQRLLLDAYGGSSIDFFAWYTESVLVRLHFVVYVEPGELREPDVAALEAGLAAAARSWGDTLREALCAQVGEGRGLELLERYADSFPPAYQDDFSAKEAVADMQVLDALAPDDDLAMRLYRPEDTRSGALRFKIFRTGEPIAISDVLPLLQNMGVRVLDERPYDIRVDGEPRAWIYDLGLTADAPGTLDVDEVRERFQSAFEQTWRGRVENDGFNRLVLRAGLAARDVVVVRAYARYLRQTASTYSQSYMEDSICNNPQIAGLLIELFHARFAPRLPAEESDRGDQIVAAVERALDDVMSLDEDRIVRSLLRVIQATLRTNYFQTDADGAPKSYLSFKLDPAKVPDLPLPRPMFEIWVYSPRMEGVHLRGGKVARGGIRWSDRREDFRTEVLGLMKAQMVKNAVIVPVGAKGGFVVKRPASTDLMAEVVHCYRTLMCGMLDITDNLVSGKVVPPTDVVRYDDDDPYLVVAADKGTATFSDIANGIAIDYGFWLADAFASGGSSGYDHKRMGITARGAWECVRRHFRELGVNIQTTDFTVAGVGDMSGDVFGNGMLLSEHIRLVAAFDHRHIFIDPDPDAFLSFRERGRLFELPRSSWADYDTKLISEGGGVFPRSAKSVQLTGQIKAALHIEADSLTPQELIRAILTAPVDLFWNGGIGTYVKASTETSADVGDKTNDPVRVDASALQCKVVGEGGNLGFTQLARVEFALAGGRINTDAIDNSAGVDCSDHEVNIKILLGAAVAEGEITIGERDELLAEMTDEVADLVLRDNYSQSRVLSHARVQAASMVEVHARYIEALERAGRLDRQLEFLPDDEVLAARKAAGIGLTTPEFAVLLAYSKLALYDELLDTDVPEDPFLSQELEAYFPSPLRERYRAHMQSHRLRREIVATAITNGVINRSGITFAYRLAEETGAPASELVRAHRAVREIFAMRQLWAAIEGLDNAIPADVQIAMQLEGRKLMERAVRLLVRRRSPLDVGATVEFFAAGVQRVMALLPGCLEGAEAEAVASATEQFEAAGAPRALAARVAALGPLFAALDIVEVGDETSTAVDYVAAVYFALAEQLHLSWLRERIIALPRDDRWQALARAALRDDVYAVHSALVADVLRVGQGAEPTAALAKWTRARSVRIEHGLRMFEEIRDSGRTDLATLSVALREVRGLLGGRSAPG
jgi:glutamate dehydrogenase